MKNTLIALHAQTSIHAGTGQNTGSVDLPIQRESHSDYPCIYGSGMKGALRACANQRGLNNIEGLFGKEASDKGFSGALLISDARLLLLPVRSLTTQFRWVTCPAILQRLKQDAKRYGNEYTFQVPTVEDNRVIIPHELTPSKLYLEEYCFTSSSNQDLSGLIDVLAQFIEHENAKNALQQQLAIISNNDFNYLCKYATPVRARNVLNKQKISENLWYEESLPPETVMYMGVCADDVRQSDSTVTADAVLKKFTGLFDSDNPWLQVGGNETVGMGWFAVNILICSDKTNGDS